MTSSKKTVSRLAARWSALGLVAGAVAFGASGANGATVNVFADPNQQWNGYINVYTNGTTQTVWPAYVSQYLGTGLSFQNQSSIDPNGNVTISPDIWTDANYPNDTLLWADASGTSPAISDVICDFYLETESMSPGDTVIFSGTVTSNSLVSPYKADLYAFIKDYSPSYALNGSTLVNLGSMSNGQVFSVNYGPVAGSGDHLQYGFEWSGPPARAASVASLGSAVMSTNGAGAPPAAKTVNVSIDHNQVWAGYQTVSVTVPYATGYLGTAAADIQGTITPGDVVRCAPDLRADKLDHTDTSVWQDDTGLSDAIGGVTADSTYYVDTGAIARNGDTVIFSGQVLTNTLVEPYASSIVAFIKDFDSNWGYYGEATVNLNTLTNGEVYSVTKAISGDGSHVQYGFEWVGPPARTNAAASPTSYIGNLGSVYVGSMLTASQAGVAAINPNPAEVYLGSNVTLTAITTGSGLTYQWTRNGVNLTDGPGISGTHTNALTLTNVLGNREGNYALVVKDNSGNSASNSVVLTVFNPAWLYFDRAFAPFNGYINVWNGTNLINTPALSGALGTRPKASFGFAVNPTTLLRASMDTNTDTITLQPNTYVYDNATNTDDPNYINPDGSAAAYLEQDYFIQNNSLVGDQLVFAGYCASNTLDPKYTATAWVKLSQDWSVEYRYDTNLVAGKPFILTIPASANTNMSYVQYGFAIWGPDNSSTNPITHGAVVVKEYSPISATASGNVLSLGFPTVINHNYVVQYKTNLLDAAWSNLSTNSGAGTSVAVPDAITGAKQRFYRLAIH